MTHLHCARFSSPRPDASLASAFWGYADSGALAVERRWRRRRQCVRRRLRGMTRSGFEMPSTAVRRWACRRDLFKMTGPVAAASCRVPCSVPAAWCRSQAAGVVFPPSGACSSRSGGSLAALSPFWRSVSRSRRLGCLGLAGIGGLGSISRPGTSRRGIYTAAWWRTEGEIGASL